MGWTYDAVGNRASEVSGGTTKTYTTPATSNRLSTVTQGTTTLRSFGYDAAGAIATDAKAGVTWTSTYDAEGRVVQAQSGTFTVGTYVYDARSKLAKRTVSNVTPAVATHYLYDPDGHVIAETTSAGVTTREYIWLDDMPVAVIDAVNTVSPVTYFVHTDHLMRPLKMTDAAKAVAWDAVWKPFGETFSITSAPKLDLGFPGQWTQSENGLAWNWHRHYDPTTGRYTKPDPLRFVDGPGLYAYVRLSPTNSIDPIGLDTIIIITPGAAGHVGMFIGNPECSCQDNLLYDPAGGWKPNNNEPRPSGDTFVGPDANLSSYLDYHKKDDGGHAPETFRYRTTPAQEEGFRERINEFGGRAPFQCAKTISGVIGGSPPFQNVPNTYFPSWLKRNLPAPPK